MKIHPMWKYENSPNVELWTLSVAKFSNTQDFRIKDYEYQIVYIIEIVDLREHLKPDNMSGKSSLGDNSHDNKTINMGDRNHFSEYFDEIVESLKVHATVSISWAIPDMLVVSRQWVFKSMSSIVLWKEGMSLTVGSLFISSRWASVERFPTCLL
jgi:endo-1,4-beta-mannosidase